MDSELEYKISNNLWPLASAVNVKNFRSRNYER